MALRNRQLEEDILQLCRKHQEPIGNDVMGEAFPEFSKAQRVDAINELLKNHKLQIFSDGSNGVVKYKAMLQQDSAKLKNLTAEDLLVYQVIQSSGNMGIWTRDMKTKTNFAQAKITKILKALEERALVKSVKSVQNSSRKVYMLAEIEPAKELTGGPWYSDNQNMDGEFIDTLRQIIQTYITKEGQKTLEQVCQHIAATRISTVVLQLDDVEKIINTLVHDMIIEKISVFEDYDTEVFLYQISKQTYKDDKNVFSGVPCGTCPVIQHCFEGGKISPESCTYYKHWLEDAW